jgi:hypothetical protein
MEVGKFLLKDWASGDCAWGMYFQNRRRAEKPLKGATSETTAEEGVN